MKSVGQSVWWPYIQSCVVAVYTVCVVAVYTVCVVAVYTVLCGGRLYSLYVDAPVVLARYVHALYMEYSTERLLNFIKHFILVVCFLSGRNCILNL